jgi:PAS domain S-box-containing protein
MPQPMFHASPTAVVIATALVLPNHCLAAVSDSFAALIGYTSRELCGRTFESFTYAADADIDSDLANRVFRGELPEYEIIKRYVHKDGRLMRLLLHASTLRDASGRIVYGVARLRSGIGQTRSLPTFQHPGEPNEEIERIKRAVLSQGG